MPCRTAVGRGPRAAVAFGAVVLFLGLPGASAQTPEGWDWSARLASTRTEYANDIAVDTVNQCVYTAGQAEQGFSGILGGAWALLFGSNTASDGYLMKQSLNGTVQWQIVVGGTGDDAITGVCVDPQGRVYVTGYFSGSNASFTGVGGSDQRMTSAGGKDIFVACYSAAGVLQWKMRAGSPGDDQGMSICQGLGQVFVGGSFNDAPAIAGLATSAAAGNATNRAHAFLVSLQAANGDGIWRVDGANGENSAFNAVATDSEQVFALGVHKGTYGYSGTATAGVSLPAAGSSRGADVLAVTMGGAINWAQAVANPGNDAIQALGLATSSTAVYMAGSTKNGSVFPGGLAVTAAGPANDYGYLARLRKDNGSAAWVRTFTSPGGHEGAQVGRSLATDRHGDVLLAGSYAENAAFPPGFLLSGAPDLQALVAKFSANGTFRWAISPVGAHDDQANAVAAGMAGKVYLSGSYSGTITFNTTYNDGTSQNLFAAKFSDLDFAVADFRDPSKFKAFGPVCAGDGPTDLATLLLPERSGTGASVFSSSGIPNNPPNGAAAALGRLPGGVAVFDNTNDQIIIDMGDTMPVGEPVILRWRSNGGTASMNVQGSLAGFGPFTDHGDITTTSSEMVFTGIPATVPMRFIKLTRNTGASCEVDGIYYNFGSSTDGTWSGDGVSGSSFDPSGLSGNVAITYSAQGHGTTHTIVVSPLSDAGVLSGGGTICPGGSATLSLSGTVGASIAWKVSTDGGSTWTSDPTGQPAYTLGNVTQPTQVRAEVTSGVCPSALSTIAVVLPLDTTPPAIANCPGPVTAYAGAGSCEAVVDYAMPTATDLCGSVLLTVDEPGHQANSVFPKGTTAVEITAVDENGNTATCQFSITVVDTISPGITCPAAVAATTNSGCTATGVDLGTPVTTDNCGVASVTPDAPAAFPPGMTTVTWTVADSSGNTATCAQTVTVIDDVPPTISCPGAVTASADAGCTATGLVLGTPVAADNCSLGPLSNNAPPAFTTGSTLVTWTVVDQTGNAATCTQTVTVIDAITPAISCPPNMTVPTNSGCSATSLALGIPVATDNCSGLTISNNAATILPIGVNQVTWAATDASGNTATCTQTITVVDYMPPQAVCQAATIPLNANGVALVTPALVDGGSTDNCSIASMQVAPNSFNSIGDHAVTLTVTDARGNVDTCTAMVHVVDDQSPIAVCNDTLLYLSTSGEASITAADLDGGSSDNGGIASLWAARTAFNCADLGPNNDTLFVTDGGGNTAHCTATITVLDSTAPIAACRQVDAYLDGDGHAAISASDLDNGSTDACGQLTYSASRTSFTCADPGAVPVLFTVTDGSGNSTSCSTLVTVRDTLAPAASCQPVTAYLAANGVATVTAAEVDAGSTDNCSITGISLSTTIYTAPGTYGDMLTVLDATGNAGTCSAVITVVDNAPPTALCTDHSLYIGSTGSATLSASDLDGGSTDNGVITGLHASRTVFDCSDLGTHADTLFVTDDSGNTSYCIATVTVLDTLAPDALCRDLTIPLDLGGNAAITAAQVDNGTGDNCSLASLTLDVQDFTCAHIGPNTVVLNVSDGSGNTASCTSTITVLDTTPPAAICADTVHVAISAGQCTAQAFIPAPQMTDNCSMVSLVDSTNADLLFSGSWFPAGIHTVTYTVADNAGNTASCASVVAVAPAVGPALSYPVPVVCPNSAPLEPLGAVPSNALFSATPAGLSIDPDFGTIDPHTSAPGTYTVTLTSTGPCPLDTAVQLVVTQAADAGSDASLAICESSTDVVDLFSLLGGNPQAGGSWHHDGQLAGAMYDPAMDGPGAYTYLVQGSNGCSPDSASVMISLSSPAHAGQDSSLALCANSAVADLMPLLAGADSGGTWSNGTGLFNPESDMAGVISYTVAGTPPCPSATASITVSVAAAPDAGSDGTLTLCANADASDLFSGLQGTPQPGGQWTDPASQPVNALFDPGTMAPGPYTYTVPGTPPCAAASSTVVVTVTAPPSAAWTAPGPLCSSQAPIDLNTFVTGAPGGNWSGPGTQAGSSFLDPGTVPVQGASTTIELAYTVTADNCTNSATGPITVWASPVANAGDDAQICGLSVQLDAAAPVGTGLWSAGNGATTSSATAPDATLQVPGPGEYRLQWTVSNGTCTDADSVVITFHLPGELTLLDAGPDQVLDLTHQALLAGIADGATERHWTVVGGSGSVDAPEEPTTGVTGLSTGQNLFMLSARVGVCPFESDTVALTVRDLFIPSGFSPNGDGVNDTFEVIGADVLADNELTVFNRWGQPVYHATGYANQWDGHGSNGQQLADDTYFYVLKFNGDATYHGQVIIKR